MKYVRAAARSIRLSFSHSVKDAVKMVYNWRLFMINPVLFRIGIRFHGLSL